MENRIDPDLADRLVTETGDLSEEFANKLLDKMNSLEDENPAVAMTLMTVTIARMLVDLVGATAFRLRLTDPKKVQDTIDVLIRQIRIPLDNSSARIAKAVAEETQ